MRAFGAVASALHMNKTQLFHTMFKDEKSQEGAWQCDAVCRIARRGMYAMSKTGSVYHLLYFDKNHTLCGFNVAHIDAEFTGEVGLHIVNSIPIGRRLCQQCDKMSNRRKPILK
jgi:hypothetical protein